MSVKLPVQKTTRFSLSLRPFYLPREFGLVTVILVYVPGPDNPRAAERIAQSYNKAVILAVDQPVFILGDFNSCDISDHLPNLEQFVTFPTRNKRTLDNVTVTLPRRRPPLGKSDHDVVHLVPTYRQKLKAEKRRRRKLEKLSSGLVTAWRS